MPNGDVVAGRMESALSVPLLRFLDASPVDQQDPRAGVAMAPTGDILNAVDAPHAGALSTLLETAAYLALLPDLSEQENAVSHNLFVGYLARAEGSSPLIAAGQVLHRTGRLAFVASQLHQDGRLLAAAQVTKSIYSSA